MIIAITNHKGGVGKTTSVLNIGHGLAARGERVLLVDMDAQANLTQCVGMEGRTPTVYDAMHSGKAEPLRIADRLDILPATLDLSGAEPEFSGEAGREFILLELLEPLLPQYDFILIDTPPSLGLLTVNALTAAEEVYIPLQAHFLAVQGVAKMLEAIEKIQRRVNKRLKLGGIFITQYDGRRTLDREIADGIRRKYTDAVLKTQVRTNVDLIEAQTIAQDVFTYNKDSNGAADYAALCEEITNRTHANA